MPSNFSADSFTVPKFCPECPIKDLRDNFSKVQALSVFDCLSEQDISGQQSSEHMRIIIGALLEDELILIPSEIYTAIDCYRAHKNGGCVVQLSEKVKDES